jgi:hypothetical protein
LHYIAFGDFAQHQPVKGRALFYGASRGDNYKGGVDAIAGRKLWVDFEYCVILKEQHRFGSDPDGQALYDIVHKLTHNKRLDGTPLSDDDIASLADALNNRAIRPSELPGFLKRGPKAVVLRHNIRPILTKILVLHHGAKNNTRVCLWRASDRAWTGKKRGGKPINHFVKVKLEMSANNETPPAVQYFYPGIPYRFLGSPFPAIGWFNNGSCIGEKLVLDEREPPDNMKGDFRVLKYQPKALIVRLPHRKLGKLCGDDIPEDCVPITPRHSKVIDFTLDCTMKIYADPQDPTTSDTIKFKRFAFPVDTAIAYTDYYAQGASFRGDPHFLHLGVGDHQGFKRGNLLVPISRPAVLSDVVILSPLWPNGDYNARQKVIQQFKSALKPDPDYQAEMERLHLKHKATMAKHYAALMQYSSGE